MASSLKRKLKNNQFLYALAALIHHRKDKEYLNIFSNIQNVVIIESNSGNLGMAPVCVFDMKDKTGLFAFLRRVVEFLYYCDNMGFLPFIKWDNSDYIDNSFSNTDNPFEYFFKQPFVAKTDSIENRPIVKYSPGSIAMARSFSGIYHQADLNLYIKMMGKIEKRYLFLKDEVSQTIIRFIAKYKIDKRTLGIHIRGTDFKKTYKNHPIFVEPNEYFPFIEEAIKKCCFSKIFIATDDAVLLNEFINHFNEVPVIYAPDTLRGTSVLGIHKEASFNEDISQYRESVNALCDVYSLAECGGLISGISHVPMFARIIKSGKDESFLYDKTINKGIHKKGINAAREKYKEEKDGDKIK